MCIVHGVPHACGARNAQNSQGAQNAWCAWCTGCSECSVCMGYAMHCVHDGRVAECMVCVVHWVPRLCDAYGGRRSATGNMIHVLHRVLTEETAYDLVLKVHSACCAWCMGGSWDMTYTVHTVLRAHAMYSS